MEARKMEDYKGKKKTFVHIWKCPKCGQQNINLRRKTTIGKKSGCFCDNCRKTSLLEVKPNSSQD